MTTYKPIKRSYYDIESKEWKIGTFIARGQWADGHLAYSLLDENGEPIEDEECSYVQIRDFHSLIMVRI